MDDNQFKEINKKLDILVKLMGASVIGGMEYREQLEILHKVGLGPQEISELTGKTRNNVEVTLHLIKKSKKKGGKKNE